MASPVPTSASASQRADESDLDPAAFLKSVRELSEKREREDAERYRKLEEDIERGKQERAARRADRARSISPQKGSVSTPRSTVRSPSNATSIASPPPLTPPTCSTSTAIDSSAVGSTKATTTPSDVPEFTGFGSSKKSKMGTPSTQSPAQQTGSVESATKPSPSASSLARSGSLIWQQRPSSRAGGSRPASMLASGSSSPTKSASAEPSAPSRDQIAASLGARDPAWFKQTADRGVGNAAFRKPAEETSSSDGFVSGRRGLPGMSWTSPSESGSASSSRPTESAETKGKTPSLSPQGSAASTSQASSYRTPSGSKADLKSLIAEDEGQAKASPMSEQQADQPTIDRAPTISSSQPRTMNAPERPSSPTKGMGGFVQSAMMKRSDSVTKRWSAQPGASLTRGDSITSTRSAYAGFTGSHSMPRMEPTSITEAPTTEMTTGPRLTTSKTNPDLTASQSQKDDIFVKPAAPSHGRSQSTASNYTTTAEEGHTSPPTSPSKRWSPNKSSWLESAITKPDSPKPSTARNSQPSWMADIAKAKAQKANAETTQKPAESGSRSASPTKEVFGQSILKRPESRELASAVNLPPKAPEQSDMPRPLSPTKAKSGNDTLQRSQSRDLATPADRPPESIEQDAPSSLERSPAKEVEPLSKANTTLPDTILGDKGSDNQLAAQSTSKQEARPTTVTSATTSKPKPDTPPKPQTDFRSNLRSRVPTDTKQEDKPEFLSRFGNLRKTQTQNYVAPDVLKDNILRGKSDLAKTGGPVKTERKDEFKESLLEKKEKWKQDKDAGIVHERKVSQPPVTPQKPEALAKREVLGSTETVKPSSSLQEPRSETPEALARLKSLKEKPHTERPLPQAVKETGTSSLVAKQSSATQDPMSISSTGLSSMAAKPTETSKLAARFDPGLAGVIGRGPAPTTNGSSRTSQTDNVGVTTIPLVSRSVAPTEPTGEDAQLQDMRKGRAKGPKKRKGGTREVETESGALPPSKTVSEPIIEEQAKPEVMTQSPVEEVRSDTISKPKPQAPPGSTASIMMASLNRSSTPPAKPSKPAGPRSSPSIRTVNPSDEPASPSVQSPFFSKAKNVEESGPFSSKKSGMSSADPSSEKPVSPAKTPALSRSDPLPEQPPMAPSSPSKTLTSSTQALNGKLVTPARSSTMTRSDPLPDQLSTVSRSSPQKTDIPEFKGFGSMKRLNPTADHDDNKENVGEDSPSVKSTASGWVKPVTAQRAQSPAQIALPNRKDEEAAMRSAGLLSSTQSRPSSSNGLGISAEKSRGLVDTPPPSAGFPPKPTKSSRTVSAQQLPSEADTTRILSTTFGTLPQTKGPLLIDAQAVITSSPHQARSFKTVRKSVQVAVHDGSLKDLPPQKEYTFFDASVYICTHAYTVAGGPQRTEIFLWSGESVSKTAIEQAETTAKKLAKDAGNAAVNTVSQGLEPPGFLQALGGILITRKGSSQSASNRYMLRGRKHLGQFVFDEVDFSVNSLCSGFAYLISYPVSTQGTRLYLWKGSAASAEEVSAARLAASLTEDLEVIEVDDGAEFSSFLKIFGSGTSKTSIPKPTELWRQKGLAPDRFATRLFRIQPAEAKARIFSSMFRRPSWGNLSPARKQQDTDMKLEAKELSPFTQSDLESDCIYLFDAYNFVYILVGPMLLTQSESVRNLLLGQTLLFASDYAMLAASNEDRPGVPKGFLLLGGAPQDLKLLFRHWDDSAGLWSGGGLGSDAQGQSESDVKMLDLNEVIGIVCKP